MPAKGFPDGSYLDIEDAFAEWKISCMRLQMRCLLVKIRIFSMIDHENPDSLAQAFDFHRINVPIDCYGFFWTKVEGVINHVKQLYAFCRYFAEFGDLDRIQIQAFEQNLPVFDSIKHLLPAALAAIEEFMDQLLETAVQASTIPKISELERLLSHFIGYLSYIGEPFEQASLSRLIHLGQKYQQ